MRIIKSADKLFAAVEAGPWDSLKPLEVEEVKEPCLGWNGPRIRLADVPTLFAFFEWVSDETNNEAHVNLMCCDEHGFSFLVMPQKRSFSMAVDVIHDHPDIPKIQERSMLEAGCSWKCENRRFAGSWHTHHRSSAFQSSHDHQDEKTKFGLHLTTGDIGSKDWSFHARASYGGIMTPVVLSDWFDVGDEARKVVPAKLHDLLIECALKTPPPKGTTFPEWWKESIVKEKPQPVVTYHRQGMGMGFGMGSDYDMRHTPQHYQDSKPYRHKSAWKYDEEEFEKECDEIAFRNALTAEEFYDNMTWLLHEEPFVSFVKAMLDYGIDVQDAERICARLVSNDDYQVTAEGLADDV